MSITGTCYQRLPHGPVPRNYEVLYALICKENKLNMDETRMGPYVGEVYTSISEPDLSIFSGSEIGILDKINEFFATHTASQIRDYSHRENAYAETAHLSLISYEHAITLSV